ncbi:MAG: hypothetical protein ACRESZ_21375 [Methylococcales bacterium]
MQSEVEAKVNGGVLMAPRAQRRSPAPSLEDIAGLHPERNAAMVVACATGSCLYREIAGRFGVHLATAGRIVLNAMQSCEN